jgi:hypothetical protein
MDFATPAKTTAETAPAVCGAMAVPVKTTVKTGKTP